MNKKTLALMVTFLVLALALSGCGTTPVPTAQAQIAETALTAEAISAEGTLIPISTAALTFAQGGLVAEVLVQPGDSISAGEVVARLVGIEAVQAELAAAQLEQIQASQALDQMKRTSTLNAAQTEKNLVDAQKAYELLATGWNLGNAEGATDLELALDDYVFAEKVFRESRDKLDSLLDKDENNRERKDAQEDFDEDWESLTETYADLQEALAGNDRPLDERQAALLNAVATLETARENLSRINSANLDPEKLDLAEARLAAAQQHAAAATEALAHYELRSPISGVVQSIHEMKAGQVAAPGQSIIYIANLTQWKVQTKDLAEIDIARVTLGQAAVIKLDAFPGEEFTGKVTAMDPFGVEYLGDMTYQVTITLDTADPRFLWNMTATVTVN